jgi:hypothetical protein
MPAYFLQPHPSPVTSFTEDSFDFIRYAAKLSTFSSKIGGLPSSQVDVRPDRRPPAM